ncbi:MAG: cytochrome c1 [Rhodanobacteraceae bacterium]|nr:cytochrome c1 [Rhodanobacteraceae bacterium]MBP9154975.1 cytochrome c1 [Xanthomonadales bacterium]HQW82359.1 cytochrome c1 [Pseudomonadota bacterium]
MKKLIALVFTLVASLAQASGDAGIKIHSSGADLSDQASLQRGAALFMNYCMGCHSLKYLRYSRMAADLGLTEAQVMSSMNFTDIKFGEAMTVAMKPADGEKWIGKAPPDLSLTARVRGSADWIYTYLKSFYRDPSRPLGWNNTLFPAASMPNVLWELQGVQSAVFDAPHGGQAGAAPVFSHFEPVQPGRLNAEEYDQVARDISNFLQYAAEPAGLKRQQIGVWVLAFLAVLTLLTWLLKHEYWRDVH